MEFDFSPVESIDKVPEQFRSLYVEGEGDHQGKFVLGDQFEGVAEAVNGFNRTTKALREEVKTVKGQKVDLSPLAEYGDNPQAIAESFQTTLEEAGKNKNTDVNKAVEAAKKGMQQAHQTELEKHTQRNEALQNQLYGLLVENSATAAVAEHKGVPELLMPFIKNQVKVTEENGEFRVQVVDASGEVRYGATGAPMTIKELVVEMKGNERYGRLFESEHPAGGGGTPPGPSRTPAPRGQELTSTQKISAGLNKRAGRRA